jgi:hypothetical protein
LKPGGKRSVVPIILPDIIPFKVELVKFVVGLTVVPNKLVSVNVQLEKVDPDKFAPDKSIEENVSDVYV